MSFITVRLLILNSGMIGSDIGNPNCPLLLDPQVANLLFTIIFR